MPADSEYRLLHFLIYTPKYILTNEKSYIQINSVKTFYNFKSLDFIILNCEKHEILLFNIRLIL